MSVAPILERTKTALESGKWWTIPWWRDDKYYKDSFDSFASKKNVETAFCELIRTFDERWMLGQKNNGSPPFSHQIAIQLLTEGLQPFQFLCELGINLHTARVNNLIGDIEGRLKNPKQYWEAAAFELKFLSSLLRNRYKVERNYPSGKGRHNCDFKVSKKSETVFLELKRPQKLIAQNQQIINKAQSRFFTKLLTDDIKEEDSISSPLSSHAEVDKVLKIIRDAVNNQIPASGAGVVIVESPLAMNWSEFEFAVKEGKRFQRRKKYPALSAVILIQTFFQNGKICHNNHIVFNPQASIDMKSSAVMGLFSNINKSRRTA